ncbi:MAG: hypothetical protein L6Q54_05295 [Leptospiraceae bacterium]|nr:hypothetical protein [Leptospiraceae bacterium]MCK6380653.1 hypothetical protein [Leptospiraceae bacterium]
MWLKNLSTKTGTPQYADKLIIFNGATLSVEVPIEKFIIPHQSKPYNPVMASVFYKCGFIENWGRGTISIVNDCKKYGLPKPTFEYEWGAVKVSFFKSRVNEGVNELFSLIRLNPNKRSKFFATQMKTSVKNIERWLKKLKEEDKIEFRGAPKTGGYFAK